jgi:23S rRNA (uracil1939-C5)-methyltransferase
MGKKIKPFVIENLEIIDATNEGVSMGKHENVVVFVPHLIPGDIADVRVIKKKRNYYTAQVLELKKESPHRVPAKCLHFGVCGGCKWQHMDYSEQLKYKQKQVSDAFLRIGKLEFDHIMPILGSEEIYYYRNKLDFAFADRKWLMPHEINDPDILSEPGLGFHVPKVFDKVIDIKECHLMDDYADKIRNEIRQYTLENNISFYNARAWEGLMRNLVVRKTSTQEWMLIVVFGYESDENIKILDFIKGKFYKITSLYYIINPKKNDSIGDLPVHLYAGKDFIEEEMEGLRFKISPLSFYQTNSRQAYTLYKVTRDFAELTGEELVYDLYTGTGTIANFVAKKAKKVVGIEYVEMAIEDAKINSRNNQLENTVFYAGDMANVFTDEFISVNGKPDVIITDPPRAGMHPKVVEQILKIQPKRIVYVSCNPATQARDLDLMREFYKITKIQPVDMFPHTQHVENVCCLELR